MSSTAQETSPPSLAIIGGGIAGLTLAIALLKHAPSLPITLYESAAAFGEIGAGVGFEPVMVRAMNLIDSRIGAAFEKCSKGSTVLEPPRWFTVRVGDERKIIGDKREAIVLETGTGNEKKKVRLGDEIFVMPARRGPRGGIHRAHFLDELVKLLPKSVAQFRKKLVNITEAEDDSGDAILHFADGSTAQHAAVLACDGIKSRTRALLLGNDPSAAAVFSGKYAYRGLIPMAKAVEILGDDEAKTPQMYIGYHGHVLTFPIANGTILNVVGFSSRDSWDDPNWVVQTSRQDMLNDYAHWSQPVRATMENLQSPDIWALFNHLPAPTYFSTKPLICLVGDAAHATTPHQGAGAGMCIEDVFILSQVLSKCSTRDDVKKAFAVYDAVRRPRSQRLVKTSKEAGMLWEFEGDEKDDLEKLAANAISRMDWIWDYDILEDMERALEMMRDPE